jgi:hypothetical protein
MFLSWSHKGCHGSGVKLTWSVIRGKREVLVWVYQETNPRPIQSSATRISRHSHWVRLRPIHARPISTRRRYHQNPDRRDHRVNGMSSNFDRPAHSHWQQTGKPAFCSGNRLLISFITTLYNVLTQLSAAGKTRLIYSGWKTVSEARINYS